MRSGWATLRVQGRSNDRLWTGCGSIAILRGSIHGILREFTPITELTAHTRLHPMPNTASAKKRLRQNEKLRLHNRAARSTMRSQIRKVREAVKSGDTEKAQSEYRVAQKTIDQAASKKLIHKNAAARTKSRLNNLVKGLATA